MKQLGLFLAMMGLTLAGCAAEVKAQTPAQGTQVQPAQPAQQVQPAQPAKPAQPAQPVQQAQKPAPAPVPYEWTFFNITLVGGAPESGDNTEVDGLKVGLLGTGGQAPVYGVDTAV